MSEHDGTTSNRVGLGPCNRIYPHESPPWCGPIDPMTYGGTKYYALFIDDFTRMTYIYPLKKKSSASVLAKFKEFKAEVETQKTGKLIKGSEQMEAENMKNGWVFISKAQRLFTKRQHPTAQTRTVSQNGQIA